MTTTAEHCIAITGLNDHRHKRGCYDLTILSLPARFYASQLVAIVVSNLLLYCTSQWMAVLLMFIAPTGTTIGSGCPEVM